MKKLIHTTYHGEIGVNVSNGAWQDANSFSLDILEKFVDNPVLLDATFELPSNAIHVFSPRSYYVEADVPVKEWQVFRKGVWFDTVYFDADMSSDEVRYELVTHDSYPADIVLL